MTEREALKRALEALEKHAELGLLAGATITAIKEALAQPEQEPVAFYVYKPTLPRGHLGNVSDGDLPWVYDQDPSSGYSARMLVYTTPPQRTWVGLTDKERLELWLKTESEEVDRYAFANAIEAKLKEKNT